jgi:hypothetical protein
MQPGKLRFVNLYLEKIERPFTFQLLFGRGHLRYLADRQAQGTSKLALSEYQSFRPALAGRKEYNLIVFNTLASEDYSCLYPLVPKDTLQNDHPYCLFLYFTNLAIDVIAFIKVVNRYFIP